MRRMNVATVVIVTLTLARSMGALAQTQAPPPAAEEPPPASMPLPGLVATTNRVSAEVVERRVGELLARMFEEERS